MQLLIHALSSTIIYLNPKWNKAWMDNAFHSFIEMQLLEHALYSCSASIAPLVWPTRTHLVHQSGYKGWAVTCDQSGLILSINQGIMGKQSRVTSRDSSCPSIRRILPEKHSLLWLAHIPEWWRHQGISIRQPSSRNVTTHPVTWGKPRLFCG